MAQHPETPLQTSRSAAEESSRPEPSFHCLELLRLESFLRRRRARPSFPLELNLTENLVEVLRKANEFVPSAAGSILLDDPMVKSDDRRRGKLTFIAAFGDRSQGLVGTDIPADRGIAGHVYRSGETYATRSVRDDPHFYPRVDELTRYTTQSLIAVPIRIEQEVCGVLELINRHDANEFDDTDRNLLEIFAGYISISIQNVLDGRQAQEIAKRDNLTGLFNDRYLHIALDQAILSCCQSDDDLAVLFIDLDYFKRVNDTYGHLAGSQVLREFGALLRDSIVGPEAIAARYGGDEFVLVLQKTGLEQAVDVAERIRTLLPSTPFCSGEGEIQAQPLDLRGLTCSIGIATMRRHLTDDTDSEQRKSTLLRLADAAMYVAKETGRNRTAVAGEPVRRR